MVSDSQKRGFSGRDVPPESVYNQCVRCGLCLPTCPTYVETLVETSSPRGRIALIKAVHEGRLGLLSPGFVHQMSECLDCRACEAACPSGVAYGQLLEPARTQIERARSGRRPLVQRLVRDFTLGTLFANFGVMRFVAAALRLYQRSGMQSLVRSSGILGVLGLAKLEAMATVFLHAGCVMHVAFAAVDRATVRVLGRAGCDVVAPASQGCCGAIAVHAGDMDRGRAFAKRNIIAFERSGADFYVVNAAGCGSTLKEYGHLFADDRRWARRSGRPARGLDSVQRSRPHVE